jgi:hypothetical protein
MSTLEKAIQEPQIPYGIYRVGLSEQLAELCGGLALRTAHYPSCEVSMPEHPAGLFPLLAAFKPTDFKSIGVRLPPGLLSQSETKETVLEEVPSLLEDFEEVTAEEFRIFRPKRSGYSIGQLRLTDADYEPIIKEQFEVRRALGKMIELDDFDIGLTPVYNPKIDIIKIPDATGKELEGMEEEIRNALLPVKFALSKAFFPEASQTASNGEYPEPRRQSRRTTQTAEELESIMKAADLRPTRTRKPRQRR